QGFAAPSLRVFLDAALVAALVAATVWALVRRPALGFLGAWFFLILAPSSSFVPVATETMAEHRMYLPLIAVVVLAAVAAWAWLGRLSLVLCGRLPRFFWGGRGKRKGEKKTARRG